MRRDGTGRDRIERLLVLVPGNLPNGICCHYTDSDAAAGAVYSGDLYMVIYCSGWLGVSVLQLGRLIYNSCRLGILL